MTMAWAMGIVVASFCITYVHLGVMEDGILPSLSNFDATDERKKLILKVRMSLARSMNWVLTFIAPLDQHSAINNVILPMQGGTAFCLSPGHS